jgi:vitamin-K-epoxide reductase (warfarin-sensitive)
MSAKARRIYLMIALLALAGAVDSGVALRNHYAKSKSSYCEFGESFNCDIVNRSSYSAVMGIPVALVGILGYLTLLGLSTLYRGKVETPAVLLVAGVIGLGFALYLTYIEAFVLAVWCILCLFSLAMIVGITALSSVLVMESQRAV